jgi:hypothetical protein
LSWVQASERLSFAGKPRVDLDDQEVRLGELRRHPLGQPFADSATNRREAAVAMTGRSPSGSRTARLSLRVDTLISIRLMAPVIFSLSPPVMPKSAPVIFFAQFR